MSIRIITRTLTFVLLCVAQVLICNHIHFLGYATPLLVIYFIVTARNDEARSLLLAEAFLIGLVMDISTNTPGMASAAFTLTALIAPLLLQHIADPERIDDTFSPSVKEMGWWRFMAYALVITLLSSTVYYLIAWFSFAAFSEVILNTVGSTATTLLLIAACERVRSKQA